jgi:dienelactone hydrolase
MITALVCAVFAQVGSGASLPVEAFGRIPVIDNVALSPNGRLIAWEDNTTAETVVVIHDLDTSQVRTRVPIDAGVKLRSLDWADDSVVLINLSITHRRRTNRLETTEYFRTLAVDLATRKSKMLLMEDPERSHVNTAHLLATRTSQPGTVVMATADYLDSMRRRPTDSRISGGRSEEGWVYSVFHVDTRTGRGRVAEYGAVNTIDWVLDASGTPVARVDSDPTGERWALLSRQGAGWRSLLELKDGEQLSIAGLSADGKAVLAIGRNGQANRKLWSIPLDGSAASVLVEHAGADVAGVVADPLTGMPLAVRFAGLSADERVWLDKKAKARDSALRRSFPGSDVWLVGRSEDFQRVVAGVDAPTRPPVYYLVDFSKGNATVVGEAYPGLSGAKLAEMRQMPYKARDGYEIPAYLTVPAGVEEKNLPLVVLPHGGPEAHDLWEFDWWAQFLASRGYAVLQPQFRGSTGYGEAHRKAGERQWGALMQDDVTDGVRFLVQSGVVDPKRVCIVGASYGGYAALAGAAFTPELYACAASVNGVTDLPQLIGYVETEYGEESHMFHDVRRQLGRATDVRNVEKSPARQAAHIQAPVLLMHGVDDTVVPVVHSQIMSDALTRLNKRVKFVKLPGEDHWLSRSETRMRVLTELETFLAEHLKPAANPVASGTP